MEKNKHNAGRKKKYELTDAIREYLTKSVEDNIPLKDMTEHLNVSTHVVYRFMQEIGIYEAHNANVKANERREVEEDIEYFKW